MTIFTGQSLNGWHKIYGLYIKHRYFIGFSIAPKEPTHSQGETNHE